MKRRIASAIDFGTSKVVCVIGEQKATGGVDIISYGKSEYAGIRRGAFIDENSLSLAVDEAVTRAQEQAHMRIRRTIVGVPGAFIRAGLVHGEVQTRQKDRRISRQEMNAAIRAAGNFDVPDDLEFLQSVAQSYSIDGGAPIRDPSGLRGSRLQTSVSCVLAEKAFLETTGGILETMHIEVPRFLAVPFVQPLFVIPRRERENTAVLLDVGAWNTDVCIVKNDALSYHSVLELGGESVTNDLAHGLNVTKEHADQIKKRYVFGLETQQESDDYGIVSSEDNRIRTNAYEDIREIIDARVEEICELVMNELDESGITLSTRSRVYVTGGGLTMIRGSREFLEAQLKMPTRIFHMDSSVMHAPCYSSAVSLLDYVFQDYTQPEPEAGPEKGEGFLKRIKKMFNNTRG
ncbi:MAG: cell division protein FtsA [Clostridiales bacterium]|jgi:cell division protein FtsA|nr:cell division protein FtsA [Clostridiales bacterium]